MGLGDFNKEDDSTGERKYTPITQEEMEEFIHGFIWDFHYDHKSPSREIVYRTNAAAPNRDSISLKVFTTIDERTGVSRGKGADAIRTVLWDDKLGHPVGGKTKTLRIETWRKNLKDKIVKLIDESEDIINDCPECGDYLVVRDGKYGKFLGCRNYPDCYHTEDME